MNATALNFWSPAPSRESAQTEGARGREGGREGGRDKKGQVGRGTVNAESGGNISRRSPRRSVRRFYRPRRPLLSCLRARVDGKFAVRCLHGIRRGRGFRPLASARSENALKAARKESRARRDRACRSIIMADHVPIIPIHLARCRVAAST